MTHEVSIIQSRYIFLIFFSEVIAFKSVYYLFVNFFFFLERKFLLCEIDEKICQPHNSKPLGL